MMSEALGMHLSLMKKLKAWCAVSCGETAHPDQGTLQPYFRRESQSEEEKKGDNFAANNKIN